MSLKTKALTYVWAIALTVSVNAADFTCDNLTVNGKLKQGLSTSATGNLAVAEGWATSAGGDASHAEGAYSSANGWGSHAEGYYSRALGLAAHAEGSRTTASGEASHAEGCSNATYGVGGHVEGSENIASNNNSHAQGHRTESLAQGSHAGGANARVLAAHTNAFIHATGTDGAKKETIFKDTAHFDRLITLSPANDHSNSVLNRWENDLRYASTGTVNGVQSQVSQQAGSISNLQSQTTALQVQTSGWNSAYAHVSRTDNPHGVTAAQVGALTNNQTNISLNGGVVAITNQFGGYVKTNHTGDVIVSGKFDVVGLHALTALHIDSDYSGTNIIDAGHETQFKGEVRLNARSANMADSLRIYDDGTKINFEMKEQTNSPYSATRDILLRARNKSVFMGYNTGFSFDNNNGYFAVGGPYVFTGGGNVGIGTNQPGERLVVVGNTIVTGKVTAAAFFGNGGGVTNINGASLLSGSVGSSQLASNAVTSVQILDGTIVAADYADNSISTGKMNSTVDARYVNASGDTMTGLLNLGSDGLRVGTTDLIMTNGNVGIGTNQPGERLVVVGNTIVTGKVTAAAFFGNGGGVTNINGASLLSGSVGSSQLASNAVTNVKIQAGAVDGSKLASGTISNILLAADAVTSAKIQDGTISSGDYANGSISTGKLDSTVDARFINASGDSMSGTLILTNNGLIVGTTQLVVTANRVGIGTNSPTKTLDVRGDANVSGALVVGSISGVGTGLTGITAAQVGAAASVHTHSQYMTNGQVLSYSQYPLALTNETYTGDVKTNRNNVYTMGTTQSFDAVVAVTLKGDGSAITNLSGSAVASMSISHDSLGLNSVNSENLDDGSVTTSKLSSTVFNTFALKNLSSYAGNNITYSNNQFHSGAGYSDVQTTNAVLAAWPGVDTNAADDLKVSGGTMMASLNMGTNRITQLADAVDNEDAVNRRVMYQAISNSVYYVPEMGDLSMGSFNSQP